MPLNLKKLREVPGRVAIIEESYDAVTTSQDMPFSAKGSVRAQGQAVQRDRTIFIDLRIQATAVQACSRCLADVVSTVQLDEHLEFQPESEESNPLEREAFTYDLQETALDLRPYVLALIEGALDLKPLCRPDCKGLCPTCRQSLNLQQCACATERAGDPRLKVLKELLK